MLLVLSLSLLPFLACNGKVMDYKVLYSRVLLLPMSLFNDRHVGIRCSEGDMNGNNINRDVAIENECLGLKCLAYM